MAKPQLGNGYTPIANELLEKVYQLKLNGTQFKIIMCIWRFTYGFSRKDHELSESFISSAIDTDKRQVRRELNNLIKLNIIVVTREATFTSTRKIKFNKYYTEWLTNNTQRKNDSPEGELDHSPEGELDLQENNIKTNIKQYIDHFNKFWGAYPKKVAKSTAEKSFKKLKVDDELLIKMLHSLEVHKQSKQWQDRQYIPNPSTWLNQKRWEDEVEEIVKDERVTITAEGTFKF